MWMILAIQLLTVQNHDCEYFFFEIEKLNDKEQIQFYILIFCLDYNIYCKPTHTYLSLLYRYYCTSFCSGTLNLEPNSVVCTVGP